MKNINLRLLFVLLSGYFILLFFSFISFAAEEEGTLGTNPLFILLAKFYYVLRFPTHTLFWPYISGAGVYTFFATLILNCLFYGLLTERLVYHSKRYREKEKNGV